jgi:hypothetical protein
MGKPLNWILSDTPAKEATSRLLRSRLAATTILAVVPFLGYGRQAYADCTMLTSVWECHGSEDSIVNVQTDAGVETDGHLTVTKEGVRVTGDGFIQFNDDNASSITNELGHGLEVRADDGQEEGRVLITTNGTITGYDGSGIYSRNEGSGETRIEISGDAVITGKYIDPDDPDNEFKIVDGINAENWGNDLIITTDAGTKVIGSQNGIDAVNFANTEDSDLTITADGEVSGKTNDAIYALNFGNDLIIITGDQSVVRGGGHGIQARNYGDGALYIRADGWVAGYSAEKYGDGIHAYSSGGSGALTIITGSGSTVRGDGDDGIEAEQQGQGNLTVNVHGSVTGIGGSFPADWEDPNPDDNTEEKGAFGIEAKHFGNGPFEDHADIHVYGDGLVQGQTAGIGVFTDNRYIRIYNEGLVRNLSGKSEDRAIITDTSEDGDTRVDNLGSLIGTVLFRAEDGADIVYNSGFWNMGGGASDFGGGYEDAVVNTGILVGADDSSTTETSYIYRLEHFVNEDGLISLVDGQHGDRLILTDQEDQGPGNLDYTASGNARLAVDAALGPTVIDPATDRLSDELIIRGDTDGLTTVYVNVVAANGANTVGIPVARVEGFTGGSDFKLNAPVSGGFFLWDMRYNDIKNWYELYTLTANSDGTGDPVLGAGAFEFPAGFAATQDIWLQTVGSVLHRQADLRSLLQGMNVTPVADYAEPVEPTPVTSAMMTPGFWFKGFGSYIQRDDERNGYDLDQKQTIYGGMAGFDFGTKEAFGNAWLFGVFGGYIGSNLEFSATNTKWNMEGPTVGAYVTYLDQAFYADATVKADFLDIAIDPDLEEESDSHTDAVNVGGRLDTGYKFGQTAFLEPQASLAVVHTEVDDVNIYGGDVEFDDDTSVRGRLGLRLGVEHTHTDATVYSADVTGSVWENFTGGNSDVTVSDTGLPDFGVSGNSQESTNGDIAVGLGAANPDGWSSFVRGNYTFADDYEAWTGNAGVRFVW